MIPDLSELLRCGLYDLLPSITWSVIARSRVAGNRHRHVLTLSIQAFQRFERTSEVHLETAVPPASRQLFTDGPAARLTQTCYHRFKLASYSLLVYLFDLTKNRCRHRCCKIRYLACLGGIKVNRHLYQTLDFLIAGPLTCISNVWLPADRRRAVVQSRWKFSSGLAAAAAACLLVTSCTANPNDEGSEDSGHQLSSAQAEERCEQIGTEYSTDEVTVNSTELVGAEEPLGEYCLIEATVSTPGDETIEENLVGFHVGLPSQWSGNFFFQGVGGFAGEVGPLDAGLLRGHASASTDTGHQGASVDGSWAFNNEPAQIDWAYRGTHVATTASKAIVEEYYGEELRHAFFEGCSNGGRQGLLAAQRYPEDFDGIVVHAPATSIVAMAESWIWQFQAQLAGEAWLTPEAVEALDQATLAAAEESGAAIGGIVVEPDLIELDLTALVGEELITAQQAQAINAIHEGSDDLGIPGHPMGHESTWLAYLTGTVPPVSGAEGLTFPEEAGTPVAWLLASELLRYFVFDDPDNDLATFDLDSERNLVVELGPLLDANDPDLSEFHARGGKLIMTHGPADPAINVRHTISYYEQVQDQMGAEVEELVRLYMVPGMDHCRGGPGLTQFDALAAMEAWVENDVAPQEISATDEDGTRQAPLCPFPAGYEAEESGEDLWRCVND